jgi:hypothetical protein
MRTGHGLSAREEARMGEQGTTCTGRQHDVAPGTPLAGILTEALAGVDRHGSSLEAGSN